MKNKAHVPTSRRTFAIAAFAAMIASVVPSQADEYNGDDYGSSRQGVNAVYVASNATAGNQILAYKRDRQGRLQPIGQFATGGTGSGGGLGNQDGLVMTDDGRFLIAVNAGSNDISLFSAGNSGLRLIDRQPSGGARPVSIAVSDDLVYVVNAGGAAGAADNISGFRISRSGRLQAISNSTRPLSTASTGPAQISFNPDGDVLLVTEKATNRLTTFTVGQDGRVISQESRASSGNTPFGFYFAGRAKVFVSNAAGGAPGAGSVSSYFVDETGSSVVLANAVPVNASAPCWLIVNKAGTQAYVTNTASNSISRLKLGSGGSVELIENVSTGSLAGPTDEALSADGRFLYVRNTTSISIFTVGTDGSLTAQPSLTGLPAGTNGLVAR